MNIVALAMTTARGLLQQKTVFLLLLFALFLLGSASLLTRFSFEEELVLFQESTLGIFSFFLSVVAIVATALVFSFDNKTPGFLLLLSKPLPRYHYLLGRLLGVFLFLSVVTLLVSALFFLLLLLREQAIAKALETFSFPALQTMMATLLAGSVIKIALLKSMLLILIQSWVLSTATMLFATMTSTSFFTIIMGVAFYFVGHLKEGLQAISFSHNLLTAWSHQVLIAISSFFPDLSVFEMSDCIPGGSVVISSSLTHAVIVALAYSFVYFLMAAFLFQRREW